MIKVFLTVVKYTPQAVMNYRRQSTAEFSIWAILLDLSGAVTVTSAASARLLVTGGLVGHRRQRRQKYHRPIRSDLYLPALWSVSGATDGEEAGAIGARSSSG